MKTKLPSSVTGIGTWNDYVNNASSNVSARFQFERVKQAGEWSYDTPIWDIKYTEDGDHYHDVGCVTAFPGDGVQATIWNNDTISGSDPFEVFEKAVSVAKDDFDLEAWAHRHDTEEVFA